MDYVREVLLRQQEALRLLLVGREPERGGTASADERPGMFSTETGFPVETAAAPTGADPAEADVAFGRGRASRRVGREGRTDGERSEELLQHSENAGRETAFPADAETIGPAWVGPMSAEPAARTVVETMTLSDHSEMSAGALSRAFQRDARRYDGGFTLY